MKNECEWTTKDGAECGKFAICKQQHPSEDREVLLCVAHYGEYCACGGGRAWDL